MGKTGKLTMDLRLTLGSAFLIVNALVWYSVATNILPSIIMKDSQSLLLWSFHFVALIISIFIGILLTKKIGTRFLLLIWTSIGIFSPLTLFAIDSEGIPPLAMVLFGVSLGLGIPSCMAYFSRSTQANNRGKFAGLIMLLIGIFSVLLIVLSANKIEPTAIILMIWRTFGLLFFLVPNIKQPIIPDKHSVSFSFVLKQRSFILYLIPWLMFSLVGYLSVPVQESVLAQQEINILRLAESIIGSVFSVITGLLIGVVGRKRIAIIAFVLVGIEFAILGMYPDQMAGWMIYTVLNGAAWGTFYVLFVMSIWGDLSQNTSIEKYYALGIIPFFISKYLSLVLGENVAAAVSVNTLFSFTAFFLFLAVLPLVYAPETLPEKVMKDRDLKSYIENAKKKAQKDADKAANNKEKKLKKVSEEKTQDAKPDKAYEEAKRLAEKYY